MSHATVHGAADLDPTATAGLRMEDVVLTYPDGDGRLTAVDHVSCRIDRGRSLAVTGPSGSGKSSLLAAAATLTPPDSGHVWLATRVGEVDLAAVSARRAAELRRTEIGIVFQQSNLVESLTAREQLEAMGWLGGRPSRPAAPRCVSVPMSCSTGWASVRWPVGRWEHCRGVSANGWPSHERWSTVRRCFWRTSRPAPWTRSRAPSWWICSWARRGSSTWR